MSLRLILEGGLRQVPVCRWFILEKPKPQADAAGALERPFHLRAKLRRELGFQTFALVVNGHQL